VIFAEVVALAENFLHGGDDLISVGVVLSEDQRLGHGRAAREEAPTLTWMRRGFRSAVTHWVTRP